MKKPFYKKWWFITIVVLLVLAVIGNGIDEPAIKSTDNSTFAENVKESDEKEPKQKVNEEEKPKTNVNEKNKADAAQENKEEAKVQESKKKAEQTIKENKLDYSIEEERLSGSIWYVTLATSLTKKKDLRKLVELTSDLAQVKNEKIDSIFVKVNIKDSLAKSYAADGKVALSEKGLVQTGLKKVNKYEFNYNVTEEHLTSKDDLRQSIEKYDAQNVLKAFQEAGLPTTDSRDNSHNCVKLECTTLITTEDVSIYEWPSVEKAAQIQNDYTFGDAQVGTIIIRMNNKELDAQPYINVLNKVVTP